MSKFWDYFDAIYCINIKDRTDRYQNCKKIFEENNIPVTFHHIIKNSNPHKGCFNSHVDIVKQSLEKNYKKIFIFEDDLELNKKQIKNLSKIKRFLKRNDDWDIFLLGIFQNFWNYSVEYKTEFIYKLKKNSYTCLHAYALNFSAMRQISKLKWDNTPVDKIYSNLFKNAYSIYPMIFYQNGSPSDIAAFKNIIPKSLFLSVFKFADNYTYYVNIPILKIILSIILSIVFVYIIKLYFKLKNIKLTSK